MKIEFQATGTAEEVTKQSDEESKKATLAATSPDEAAGVEGVYDAVGAILTTVEGDRQATVTAQAEVTAELTKVYLDITIVPSGAAQEAKADADRVNVRQPAAPIPAAEEEEG